MAPGHDGHALARAIGCDLGDWQQLFYDALLLWAENHDVLISDLLS